MPAQDHTDEQADAQALTRLSSRALRTAWTIEGIGFLLVAAAAYVLIAHPSAPAPHPDAITSTTTSTMADETLIVRSPAFGQEERIPSKYTCDGENLSPPLAIDGAPTSTVSLALIMEDPDVPTSIRPDGVFDHWVVFNIPATTTRIGEGEEPAGGTPGTGTSGKRGYVGPCPPDREHRYLFHVYALDRMLDLPAGASKQEVLGAMAGHTLESTTLMGRYARTPHANGQ